MMKRLCLLGVFCLSVSACTAPPANVAGASGNGYSYESYTRLLAERGDADAQFSLGSMYDEGRSPGVGQDHQLARFWYGKAAGHGNAKAQFNLGILYYSGKGMDRDLAQAKHWWEKAAGQGDANAQFNLALMYARGDGVPKDNAVSMALYKKAAEQGQVMAQYNLALMYYEVQQDYKQSFYWYEKAAEQGHAMAQNSLGSLYSLGQGVPQDPKQAIYWWSRAGEQRIARSQYYLAVIYEKDARVKPDLVLAYALYDRALFNSYLNLNKKLPVEGAEIARDSIAKKMTREQIAAGDKLIAEMAIPNNFKGAFDAYLAKNTSGVGADK